MLEFDTLRLRRYALFKDASFTFQKGMTFFGGANFTGKSLFFSSLLSGLYGKDSDIKIPDASTFDFQYRHSALKEENDYRLTIKTNKSTKYAFFKNGEDQQAHKIADAKRLIEESFPIPYELFTATTYLRAIKEHPLLKGGPTQRSEWLSTILDIVTVYDDLHTQVRAQLDELKAEEIRKSVLVDELKDIVIPPVKLNKVKAEQAEESLDALSEEFSELTASRIDLSNKLTMLETLPDVEYVHESDKILAEKSLISLNKKRQRFVDMMKVWSKYNKIAKTLQRRAALAHDLEMAFGDVKLNTKLLLSLHENMRKLNTQQKDYEKALKDYENQQETRDFLHYTRDIKPTHSVSELMKLINGIEVKLNYIKQHGRTLTALQEIDGSQCPTCGGKLNKKHAKEETKRLREEYASLAKSQKQYATWIDVLNARTLELIDVPKRTVDRKTYHALQANIDALTELLDIDVEEIQPPAYAESACLHYIEKIDKANSANKTVINNYNKQVYVADYPDDVFELFMQGQKAVKMRIQALTHDLKSLIEKTEKVSTQKTKLQTELAAYKANKGERQRALRRTDEVKTKLQTIEAALADVKPLNALLTAFGNSGLRMQQLKESADILSGKMTEFSPLCFNHPYVFKMDVAYRKLDLNIKRNGLTASLSTLSGAETRFFHLLFGLSMLPLLPNRLRADTIILDEIDSMLDEPSRERYAKDILPEVRRHVPKVIVVSPLINGELNIDADRNYRVIKRQVDADFWQSEIKKI